MQIPNIRAFVFSPCLLGNGSSEQGVQSVDTPSGCERKWLVGEITQRVHQPASLRKLLLDAPTLLKKTPPPARFPRGMSDQWSLGRGE